eukprot:scaffold14603_cov214-Alexandrium_tamarense.AAC.1
MNTSAFKLILFQSRALLTHHDHIRHHHNNNRCPPCKSFTPLLIDFYNANKEDLEIIFLSSDRDEESFNGYFGKMPWLSSIPGYSSQEANGRQKKLASMFQIQGIPSLIILDAKTGNFITDNARITVMQASNPTSKKELLQTWLTTEAVPIDDAVMGASNGGGGVGIKVFGEVGTGGRGRGRWEGGVVRVREELDGEMSV